MTQSQPNQQIKSATNQSQPNVDPFRDPSTIAPRLRLFIWGPPGAGKTRSALSMGKCAYISLEKGAQYYADEFDFRLIEPTTFEEILNAVRWLATNQHDYNTVVIDPITTAWDMVQEEFLTNKRAKKGPEATITGGDWKDIKPRYKTLLKLLTNIDMNVVIIAQSTKNYVDSAGDSDQMLKVDKHDPESANAEKSTAYIFDTEIQLRAVRSDQGRKVQFMATVRKDRTGKFPSTSFEFTGAAIRKYFGAIVDATSKAITLSEELQAAPKCERCSAEIEAVQHLKPAEVATESKNRFGEVLCLACRRVEKARREEESKTQSPIEMQTQIETPENQ